MVLPRHLSLCLAVCAFVSATAFTEYNSEINTAIEEIRQANNFTAALDSYQDYLIGSSAAPDPLNIQRVSGTDYDRPGQMRGFYSDNGIWKPTQGHLDSRSFIYNTLGSMNLHSVSYQDVTADGYSNARNIIGRINGKDTSKAVVIGAHYDATAQRSSDSQRYNYGGSDNATGVAGVLEIARVLSQSKYEFDYCIEFVLFDTEESRDGWGVGSSHYAANSQDTIAGMASLDMIGYNHNAENTAKLFRKSSEYGGEFISVMESVIDDYQLGLNAKTGTSEWSDHNAFDIDNAGLLIEDVDGGFPPYNPYYHKYEDYIINENYDYNLSYEANIANGSVQMYNGIQYIDMQYAAEMTKLALGWAAYSANLTVVPEPAAILILGLGSLILRRRKSA
ncbi:Bacterial leucyl aminopeptidase precursor [Limihaloglobus sulfuriphilus]|uniref:Bacterial leucyl aminopeptidase n=1 Tax=Limihaloglobus sulfuriphilus TaxID=1851148 RepID=A0A1Q2MEV4_9BACT|nr:M28 family peptidase [Limihaloglobus sulfuriphilus]AQQ71233.1 Bacterial leucyl aminopeptidase precursor [Limihaloglobus sulfuriphilus]